MNINNAINQATKSGFENYGTFSEDGCQHEILTCTKGRYSGEVIDLYYDFNSGSVSKVEVSSQFKNQLAKFKFK